MQLGEVEQPDQGYSDHGDPGLELLSLPLGKSGKGLPAPPLILE